MQVNESPASKGRWEKMNRLKIDTRISKRGNDELFTDSGNEQDQKSNWWNSFAFSHSLRDTLKITDFFMTPGQKGGGE